MGGTTATKQSAQAAVAQQHDVHHKIPPPSHWQHLKDDVRALRLITKEDLRMVVEKVTGVELKRGPTSLSDEQASGDKVEHDHPEKQKSAYGAMAAPPQLSRPVLMIPGLTMDAASFDPMTDQLGKDGKNGSVAVYNAADGHFHLGGVAGAVMTKEHLAHVHMFQLQYVDAKAAPQAKESQIASALAAIQAATGAGTVDVVTHSAGGTDFRLYLEDKKAGAGPAIGNTVMIGPASHGTFMGDVGAKVGKPMGIDKAGAALAMNSPLIEMLNRDWQKQRGQITGNVTIIAVGGAQTVGHHGITDGDGYMPLNEAAMPGADTIYLHGLDPTPVAHLREVEYSGVIECVQQALARGNVTLGPKK